MKPAKFLNLWMLAPAALSLTACQQGGTDEEPPNIIYIMTDDHAYQAISAYGSDLIETPNIDELAEDGIRFDQAFVTNSISSPSRAVCLTGMHSHKNAVRDNVAVFDSSQQTFPKLLQEEGYQTAVVGKWHLKSQPTGFDHWKVLQGQGNYYHPTFRTPEGKQKTEGYVTDVITDEAIDWLKNRDSDKPFMMMYQHKAPHREWWPSQEDLGAFMDEKIPQPKTLFDDYAGRGTAAKEAEMRIKDHMGYSADNKIHPEILDELGIEEFMDWYRPVFKRKYNRLTDEERQKWDSVYDPINERFQKGPPQGDSLLEWRYQRYMQDYLACIRSVDRNIGRLMDYLEKSGLEENTLVMYTSDQGFYLGEHGWFDKRFMYRESFRTPLIARWPGHIRPGTVDSNLVQNLDFAETILDAAGVEVPSNMQGRSLVPLFDGEIEKWRDALYYHYYAFPTIHMVKRHYGIRTERYKLIHFYYDVDEWELYDMKKDPHEMQNVYDKPEYKEVRKMMHRKLDSLRKVYGDSDSLTQKLLREDLKQ
ncbi:MAG: sulfatase [Bacteroidales bacterium]|nr:sulfatase [Bacteroidales bacterium]